MAAEISVAWRARCDRSTVICRSSRPGAWRHDGRSNRRYPERRGRDRLPGARVLAQAVLRQGPGAGEDPLVDDTVLCVLEGGFTVVERTLIEVGRAPAVHDIRTSFQAAMREQFTAVVESALGRRVRAYLSQVHTDPDIAVELFLLEPEDTNDDPE